MSRSMMSKEQKVANKLDFYMTVVSVFKMSV